jgi:signal transduction histidine kinase
MVSTVTDFFSAGVLAPHAICLLWRKDLIAVHGISDLLIALSYFAIPILILKGADFRPDLVNKRVAVLFALFITACGVSHLAGLLTLWFPYYGWQALVKLLTAIISLVTVYHLWRLWPGLMELPSSEQLAIAKADLIAQEKILGVAEETNTKLQEFAHLAAHDLSAPLNTLRVITELMDPADSEAEMRENIDDLNSQAQRMQRLIDDLLHYSKIGSTARDAELVDVASLIENVLGIIAVPEHFVVTCESDTPQILMVREEVEMILRNLISNSIKHHQGEKGKIHIVVGSSEQQITVSVADDGPGIPDKHKPLIFRQFYRIAGNKNKGSGMGLAAVARAVEVAKGTVSVQDRPSGGAVFSITLPTPDVAGG